MRWAGIDEAGYGPNLGPLVMTAVVAEGPDGPTPDVWSDLAPGISRVGSLPPSLWVDDSKKLYRGRRGRDRLEAAALATVDAAVGSGPIASFGALLDVVGAGTLADAELDLWLPPGEDPPVPSAACQSFVADAIGRRTFDGANWRLVGVRSVVVGPARFNRWLGETGNKAGAHFSAFAPLLRWLWEGTTPAQETRVRADKHGGRHFYLGPLSAALPGHVIEPFAQGPALSSYEIREQGRTMKLDLLPRADAEDGLVALASIVSKTLREWWMDAFNNYWVGRIPGLPPTAGYPVDAVRFRAAIEPTCQTLGLDPARWWRLR